ncbi:hypothetical protein DID80_01505 [Candidatus Marinamargulisbacteria bacterium SCGC AAA071-K20]|nr:hypothetical protein DID80_01505 [Candidatus Marinamargulisbacteria bacterium SCGC AAA071-K20]
MQIRALLLLFVVFTGSVFANNLIVKNAPVLPYTINLVPTNKKLVALTFDDGPHVKHTKKILKILKKNKAKGTFFLIANQCEKHPELTRSILKGGHEVGNHSYAHLPYPKLNKSDRLIDIAQSQKVFKSQTGTFPRYFRAPYGKMNKESKSVIKRFFKHHISWTIDPKDWEEKKENVTEYISQNIQPGAIILLHETNKDMLKTLPLLVTELKSQGYSMVTISKLLEEYETY